jgi:DhnA family fructose-bisphosphate aldolase class Ia
MLRGPKRRLVSVALDHGVFGAAGITTGVEDLEATVKLVVAASPDVVQLSLGSAERLIHLFEGSDVALVARLDLTNAYAAGPSDPLYSMAVAEGVERASRIGASAVVVNLLSSGVDSGLQRDCLDVINTIRPQALEMGIPFVVEPLALAERDGSRYAVNGATDAIVPLVRQASELGADLIKADPTDNLDEYHKVIEAAGVPVLVRGGGRVDDEELLDRTRRLIQAGASGVVYGRNVFQHEDPAGITARLMDLVHTA